MIAINDDEKDKKNEGDTIQEKRRKQRQKGISKKDFHAILDKASQPVKREAESDSEQP